jgi:hypothetical protein
MTPRKFVKPAAAVAAFAALVLTGMLSSSKRVQALDDDEERNESKIRIGFEIAPVHLNLHDKNRQLVGLGRVAHLHDSESSEIGIISPLMTRLRHLSLQCI